MGLIYNPTESGELVSNFNANITACEQIISDLKTGNSHLVFALNSKLLSGAAFNAGLSMFSQLVNPTVDKVDTSIQELKTKLQQYTQYTDAAGSEILDEDKLNEQLEELRRQQAMVSSQIRFYQNQARLNDTPELTAMCYNHASELNSYMSTIYEDIRKVEEKLKKLHELDMKIASLFSNAQNEIQNLSTGILAINSVSIDSSGNFSMKCSNKDLARINKFLSDKGSKSKGNTKKKLPKGSIIPNPLDIIGKLFGKNEITFEKPEKIDSGRSYIKTNVKTVKKGKGIFQGNFTNGKFSGISIDLGFVSTDLDFHDWNLSSSNTLKIGNFEIGGSTSIGSGGLNMSVGAGNGSNRTDYGFDTNADWTNGLISLYGKNTTTKELKDDIKISTSVETGNKYLNGGQASVVVGTIVVVAAVVATAPVTVPGGIVVAVASFLGLSLAEGKSREAK